VSGFKSSHDFETAKVIMIKCFETAQVVIVRVLVFGVCARLIFAWHYLLLTRQPTLLTSLSHYTPLTTHPLLAAD
jgi:hypothetical protein